MSDITPDDIEKVWDYLKTRANVEPKQLVYFSDIERELGRELYSSQWHLLLDPIYEEVKIRQRKPDLTCIVVFKTGDKQGYPPYFSDGGPVRSRQDSNRSASISNRSAGNISKPTSHANTR
jgi:hypothetical protein